MTDHDPLIIGAYCTVDWDDEFPPDQRYFSFGTNEKNEDFTDTYGVDVDHVFKYVEGMGELESLKARYITEYGQPNIWWVLSIDEPIYERNTSV